jgi:hypothetical protein
LERGHNLVKTQHLADAQLQEHDAREQAKEQTGQIAVSVACAIKE